MGIYSKVHLIPADLLDMGSLLEALIISKPDEVYNLAAQSFVSTAFEQPIGNAEITGLAVTKLLESIRHVNPKIKFYQASSSEMFGNSKLNIQNEKTPFAPASPYAAAKLYAHEITNTYKDAYGIFATSCILFNHESPLRGIEFVTRKITYELARIKYGKTSKLSLGNIKAKRDWGFAGDYVEAMWLMLQQKEPDNYVIATGESHSVEEFLTIATEYAGLGDWRDFVEIDEKNMRPTDIDELIGDASKAKKELNWKPKVDFKNLVKMMIDHDMNLFKLQMDPLEDRK